MEHLVPWSCAAVVPGHSDLCFAFELPIQREETGQAQYNDVLWLCRNTACVLCRSLLNPGTGLGLKKQLRLSGRC